MADDLRALAAYVHELHVMVGKMLINADIGQLTDDYYRPHAGGPLEAYLKTVDEVAERFGVRTDDVFYPDDGKERPPNG